MFIFLHAQENRTKRTRPCRDPSGAACALPSRPDAPKLALLVGRAQTVAASFSAASAMLGFAAKGKNQRPVYKKIKEQILKNHHLDN
jgi:hypothetical protein